MGISMGGETPVHCTGMMRNAKSMSKVAACMFMGNVVKMAVALEKVPQPQGKSSLLIDKFTEGAISAIDVSGKEKS
jgi:hypothetical protein